MSSTEYRLTTVDNPYDPFKQFDSWFIFDVEKGYNTCGYLARVTNTTSDMTDDEYNKEVERGIDDIIKNDFLNIYKKVSRPTSKNNK